MLVEMTKSSSVAFIYKKKKIEYEDIFRMGICLCIHIRRMGKLGYLPRIKEISFIDLGDRIG